MTPIEALITLNDLTRVLVAATNTHGLSRVFEEAITVLRDHLSNEATDNGGASQHTN